MGSKAEALLHSYVMVDSCVSLSASSTTTRAVTPQTLTACRACLQGGVTVLLTQHPGQLLLHAARIRVPKCSFTNTAAAACRTHAFTTAAPRFAVAA